jgi:O-antigen biosynthesis protein
LNTATIGVVLRVIKGHYLLIVLLMEKWLTHFLGGKRLYHKHLRFLVNKTELFDPSYYLEMNPGIGKQRKSPLANYVAYGDEKGCWPMPFFDPLYYRNQVKSPYEIVNALLHYAYIGRYLRLSPSPWFDVKFYLKENKDVARSGKDPVLHYLRWGGTEGRSPNVQFDGSFYLRSNPDVREARVNPLLHYLRIGRFEGRPTSLYHPLNCEPYITYPKAAEQQNQQKKFLKKQAIADAKVDVIVPVYKDTELSLRTIYSVLMAEVSLPFELIVINDGSPETKLIAELEKLESENLITLVHHLQTKGFFHTLNEGMQLHSERDVVLLNSDTEVFNHWLDKLYATAYRQAHTGTVTPLSNNATICSYPCFLNDNPYPLELPYEEINDLAAAVNPAVEIETPTGIAFCLYIRRACIQAVGLFDTQNFGQGYGAENDFCQRAISKSWRNVISADTFVRHWGVTSFQRKKPEPLNEAFQTLSRLYPGYRFRINKFIKQDPLAQARQRLDWARLLRQIKQQNVLIICHCRGGGSERHVQEDTAQLLNEGIGVFYLRPVPNKPTHVRLGHPKCPQLFNLDSYLLKDTDRLTQVLAELHITRIHTHGLVDFAMNAPKHILKLAQSLKAQFWIDLHDYKVICPRINLTHRSGRYCGEPDELSCNACCEREGNDFGVINIKSWRRMHHNVLKQANKISVPDLDIKNRLLGYFPDISLSLSPHEEFDLTQLKLVPPNVSSHCSLKIVVIGAIGKPKGLEIFNACARDAKKRKLPLEFILLGYSLKDEDLKKWGVKITGRYLDHEAPAKLKELAPHVAWLPSTWPETYSYTLSLALNCGYPTFAFDIGAIAARLRAIGQEHTLMPLQMLDSPSAINDRFVNYLKTCQTNSLATEHDLETQPLGT